MSDIVFDADVDVRKLLRKLDQVEKKLDQIGDRGAKSMTRVQTTGNQRFRQLGFALQRFGIGGAAAFGEIFVAAGAAGVAIGAVLIAVKALSAAFNVLYNAAKKVMTYIIETGVEAARGIERAEKDSTEQVFLLPRGDYSNSYK